MYTKNVLMYRQGDLLLTAIKGIPRTAKLQKTNIIFEGEVTGHAHRLNNGKLFISKDSWTREQIYIDARNGKSYLSHEEHKRINLQANCYMVTRQREYQPEIDYSELHSYSSELNKHHSESNSNYLKLNQHRSFRWIRD